MIAEAMDWIERHLKPATQMTEDGRQWIEALYHVVEPPTPEGLAMTGLESFVAFTRDLNEPRSPTLVVVVDSITRVSLYGILGALHREREYYGHAVAGISSLYPGGQWLEQDKASRLIQQYFEPSPDRAKLLELVGNLTAGSSRTLVDDGVTQQATTRRGIKAEINEVPNPVLLASFETFAEIQNPERSYVVRLEQEEGQKPLISLNAIPDPTVEQATQTLIRQYLANELGATAIVL